VVDPAPGGLQAAPGHGFQDRLLSREFSAPLDLRPYLPDRLRGQPGNQRAAEPGKPGLELFALEERFYLGQAR